MVDNIEAPISKSVLLKQYIVLILARLYDNSPSPTRFGLRLAEELTGYSFKTEEGERNILTFFETIDFLNREGYLRCSSFYVSPGNGPEPVIHSDIPAYISEKGINQLEEKCDGESYIDKFRKISLSIVGRVAEKSTENAIVAASFEAVKHFMRAAGIHL